MQSVGSLKSAFSGNVQAFQSRSSQTGPKRGQLQVSALGGTAMRGGVSTETN